MLSIEWVFGAILLIAAVVAGVGGNCMTFSPPDYVGARWAFSIAFLLVLLVTILSVFFLDEKIRLQNWKLLLPAYFIIFGVLGSGWIGVYSWMLYKEQQLNEKETGPLNATTQSSIPAPTEKPSDHAPLEDKQVAGDARKDIHLAFEPQIEFQVIPETPDHELRFYDIRFVVRNTGKDTVNKLYYKFTFPYDCLIPTDKRLGRGDRDLFLDSTNRVLTTEGKKFYSMGGLFKDPIFEGRSINVGNLSLMEPLIDFNVRWDLSWEGGTKSGIMTFENGKLKIEPR